MARELQGSNDAEKLKDLGTRTYKEQSIWFLNAFWDAYGKSDAEKIWDFSHYFGELDLDKKAAGCALDELNAHRFLEKIHETLTVHALRENLRSTGAIGSNDRPKTVPIVHYLLFKYNSDFHYLVNAPQGNREEIAKAERMLEAVNAAFREATAREEEARASENEARARENDARLREEELRAAQAELDAALAELQAQEHAFNSRTEELKRLSTTGGLVSQNRAKNELAQHLASDPLPLRRAKITQEAAVAKNERATKAAAEARVAAEHARDAAVKAREAAEEAVEEARRKVEEAEAYLEEVKKSNPEGAIWWLERELHEAKAYLPASKGGYKKDKK